MTDEEYIERLEYCQFPMTCCICQYKDSCELDNSKTVDLIHRLQDENKRLNNAVKNFQRCIDNGEFVSKDMFDRQKAEIERLTEEKDKYQTKWQRAYMSEIDLQRQVDELKEKIMNLKSAMIDRVARKSYDTMLTTPDDVEEIFGDAYESEFNGHLEQAIKETAKEILQEGKYCLSKSLKDWIKERYGVEVE